MLQKKKLITAGATFSAALGIGFVMQNGDVLAARSTVETDAEYAVQAEPFVQEEELIVAEGPALEAAPVETEAEIFVSEAEQEIVIEEPQAPILLAAVEPEPVFKPIPLVEPKLAAITSESLAISSEPLVEPETVEAVRDCTPEMTATSAPAAFAQLELVAPCHGNAGVTIHHQGMMFSAITDQDGYLSVIAPALAEEAVFIAAFDTGDGAVATLEMPELAMFERAVLQWQGESAFAINAYENGAEFGEDGHVSAIHARDFAAIDTEQGFLMPLGDPNAPQQLLAEVYTFPAGLDENVVLSVDASITKTNCNREVNAQSIQVSPGLQPEALDLVMIMPSCDSVGDYLVLKNMFKDLKLAAN